MLELIQNDIPEINLSDFDTLQIPEKYRHLFRK